jgi:hypothetical protein
LHVYVSVEAIHLQGRPAERFGRRVARHVLHHVVPMDLEKGRDRQALDVVQEENGMSKLPQMATKHLGDGASHEAWNARGLESKNAARK